jgi:xylulokinase
MGEPAMSDLLLGVDIGTASSKAVLTDGHGTIVARASVGHDVSAPRPGWFEHDAEHVWWHDFVTLVRQLVGGRDLRSLRGLAVSGLGPCLLPADAAGRPLRPAILYGIDTRATAEIEELAADLGRQTILDVAGSPLTSQAVGPKVLWLRRHEPDVWGRTRKLLMASSYLVHRITGEYVLDHPSASQCTPLYELSARDWHTDWASRIAPGVELPRLAWPTEIVGRVSPDAARTTGLPAGLPVTAGTVDTRADSVSVGVRDRGQAMLMYGSTAFLLVVTDQPLISPSLWSAVGVFPGSYALAAGMATAGWVTQWISRLVGSDYATLTAAARDVPAGARGLLMLPYFAGERTPLFDSDARGLIAGLTVRHGPRELYRAALEAVAFGIRHNLETMISAGASPASLTAVGGGVADQLWPQIVSSAIGLDQSLPAETMGASLGDALLAGLATGVDVDAATWNPTATTIHPRPDWTERYDALYPHYLDLYTSTRETAHLLASLDEPARS